MGADAAVSTALNLSREQALGLYAQMLRIRGFEEKVRDLYMRAAIGGIVHLSIGQEASAVGVCAALRNDDYITSTHRGHGHCIAKGADFARMFAELLGKETGYCRGKGGSMHIANQEAGNLGANAIVGGGIPIATGAGLTAKLRKSGQVAVSFFGDGALNQGVLTECMNMAAIWRLPVIYACENNQYGEYTPVASVTAGNIPMRGEALGIPSRVVDGMDVLKVYGAALECVERARSGGGPSLLVLQTYRYFGHGMSDVERSYRSREEEQKWRESRDPIDRWARHILDAGYAREDELSGISERLTVEIEAAVQEAQQAPFPDPAEVNLHVYND
jgi:pyruvate dehydrogenase E1 component alpha subunit